MLRQRRKRLLYDDGYEEIGRTRKVQFFQTARRVVLHAQDHKHIENVEEVDFETVFGIPGPESMKFTESHSTIEWRTSGAMEVYVKDIPTGKKVLLVPWIRMRY